MNDAERAAYRWLVEKYGEDGVSYRPRRIPRFVTYDGKLWEPRRLYGSKILIYPQHVAPLFEQPDRTFIVVVRGDRVVMTIPVSELSGFPARYRSVEICWLPRVARSGGWGSHDVVALILAFTIWRIIEDFDPKDWERLGRGEALREFVERGASAVLDFLRGLPEEKKAELGHALRKKMGILTRVIEECRKIIFLT